MSNRVASIIAFVWIAGVALLGCERVEPSRDYRSIVIAERGHVVLVTVRNEAGEGLEGATVIYGNSQVEDIGDGLYRIGVSRPVGGRIVRVVVDGYFDELRNVPEDAVKRADEETYEVLVVVTKP